MWVEKQSKQNVIRFRKGKRKKCLTSITGDREVIKFHTWRGWGFTLLPSQKEENSEKEN